MITIFGIPNCDKCRAAVKWFAASGLDFSFHDLRTDGLTEKTLKHWQNVIDDVSLINKRSTTWRKIPVREREGLDPAGNRQLILENPTLLKRPIVVRGSELMVGYDEARWTNIFLNGK